MKILSSLILVAIAYVAISSFTTESKIYYYCHSRTLTKSGKIEVRISRVYSISTADTAGWTPNVEWGNWVREDSNGQEANSSDFNSYPSKANAEKSFNGSMRLYSDTSKYILKKVDFRLKASKK